MATGLTPRPARARPLVGRLRARFVLGLLLMTLALAGCGIGEAPASPTLVASPSPSPVLSAAVAATRAELVRALGEAGLLLDVPRSDYRPPEPAAVAALPRTIFRAVLPADPTHGNIVVYELPTAGEAAEVGREYAAWLATGPGRIQFPPDTQLTLRQVGSTLVFYAWSPASSSDPQAPDVAPALETVGIEIPIPA